MRPIQLTYLFFADGRCQPYTGVGTLVVQLCRNEPLFRMRGVRQCRLLHLVRSVADKRPGCPRRLATRSGEGPGKQGAFTNVNILSSFEWTAPLICQTIGPTLLYVNVRYVQFLRSVMRDPCGRLRRLLVARSLINAAVNAAQRAPFSSDAARIMCARRGCTGIFAMAPARAERVGNLHQANLPSASSAKSSFIASSQAASGGGVIQGRASRFAPPHSAHCSTVEVRSASSISGCDSSFILRSAISSQRR